jgi:multiple sugar transport system ATP-binding protein
MANVILRDFVKRYGTEAVVDHVSLDVADGEFLVLVGPSGCGKSTTLRMIAGLEDVTEGRIEIGGQDVTELPPKDRDIAMVFQNYALYPHMDVARNMSFSLRLARVPKKEIERRVDAAARILGIEHLLRRKPKELSGGQRQRVAMGRAIVREPKVFLFDEPLSNLDAKLRGQMRIELALLHQRLQKTVVYVTHDQIEAMTLASRIVVMERGRVQQIGTPTEVYNHPANLFVAGFIGSPTMNFIEAELIDERDELALVGKAFKFPIGPALRNRFQQLSDRACVIGIRPQQILPVNGAARPDAARLRLRVAMAEYVGPETIVIGVAPEAPSEKLTVCVASQSAVTRGDIREFEVPLDHLHVFDKKTGARIH